MRFASNVPLHDYLIIFEEVIHCSVLCFNLTFKYLHLFCAGDGNMEVDLKSLIEVLSSSAPNCRLPKLHDLSSQMYALMMKCWHTDPGRRPSFEYIRTELQTIV